MLTVGLGVGTRAFFTASIMVIALPTGIESFSWVAAMCCGVEALFLSFYSKVT